MTIITINRATVEQALEALELLLKRVKTGYDGMPQGYGVRAANEAVDALRAALAQKHDPVAHSGWVLREVLFDNGEPIGHREPQHSPAALAQQAEPLPAQRVHLICKTCMGIGYDSSGQRCEDCQP